MRYLAWLTLGLALLASPAAAAEKKVGAGTLARPAIAARMARLAEIAKDASPPKPGQTRQPLGGGTVSSTPSRQSARR